MDKKINFEEALKRLQIYLDVHTLTATAERLHVSQQLLSKRKKAGNFPTEYVERLMYREPELEIDLEYVLTGNYSEFEEINSRFKQVTKLKKVADVVDALKLGGEEFIEARIKDQYPIAAVFEFAKNKDNLDVDYVLYGLSANVEEYGIHIMKGMEYLKSFSSAQQAAVLDLINQIYAVNVSLESSNQLIDRLQEKIKTGSDD